MRFFWASMLVIAAACSARLPVAQAPSQATVERLANVAYVEVDGSKEELALISEAARRAGWKVEIPPEKMPKSGNGWTIYSASPALVTMRLTRPAGDREASMLALITQLKPVADGVTIRAYDAEGRAVD